MLPDEPTASFGVTRIVRESLAGVPTMSELRPARASVEILRQGGGLMPRALVGGSYTPGNGELLIEVQSSGEHADGNASCVSQLSRSLVPGLPDEFSQSVIDGLVRRPLPSGRILVDRAAFDPVESSPLAFELAAELLASVLYAVSAELDVEQTAREALEGWS